MHDEYLGRNCIPETKIVADGSDCEGRTRNVRAWKIAEA